PSLPSSPARVQPDGVRVRDHGHGDAHPDGPLLEARLPGDLGRRAASHRLGPEGTGRPKTPAGTGSSRPRAYGAGMTSVSPGRIRLGSVMLLASTMASTVTPNCAAIAPSVSPSWTVYSCWPETGRASVGSGVGTETPPVWVGGEDTAVDGGVEVGMRSRGESPPQPSRPPAPSVRSEPVSHP